MSRTTAERAAFFGGSVVAGALVAACILYFWPRRPAPERDPGEVPETPAVGTAEAVPDRPADPEAGTGNDQTDRPRILDSAPLSLRKEIERLRRIIDDRDDEIRRLRDRLEEAGVPLEAVPADPSASVKEAIEGLRRCGPETPPRDIEAYLDRIAAIGPDAVDEIVRFLDTGMDVQFAESWSVLGGRFVGYPGLRAALLDTLNRIGGIAGQSALVSVLRGNQNALEITVIIGFLEDIRNVASVDEVRIDAAHRYLDLEPPRGESLLVGVVLDVLRSELPPERAAENLLAYAKSKNRGAAIATKALARLTELPEEVALPALASVAADPAMGEKAASAAELMGSFWGANVTAAMAGVLETGSEGARREIYRSLPQPISPALGDIERTGRRVALEAMNRLTDLQADIDARLALVDARIEAEPAAGLQNLLQSVRKELRKLARKADALETRLKAE